MVNFNKKISEKNIKFYNENGWVVLREVFNKKEIFYFKEKILKS